MAFDLLALSSYKVIGHLAISHQPLKKLASSGWFAKLRLKPWPSILTDWSGSMPVSKAGRLLQDHVAHPDVGPQMQAYYGYAEDDILRMVTSQVGPLPVFILQRVELMRAAKADALEAGKEKSKAPSSYSTTLSSALPASNPTL
ncbi:hypothetical protein BDZ89DRAFT_1156131 [Hymenopellis radicata]|nr:hypothetical protein BDZ89DRAFT_1156131 [Hymenopellis radicata]